MANRSARATSFFLACALLLSLPARAIESASASFRNTRSSVDSGGRRKTSASYRMDGVAAGVSAPAGASASYRIRDGHMGHDFYPGRVSDLWGSTVPAIGGVFLQWTAPGNDGDESSTVRAYVVKYSSVAAQSPATSDANFEAASSLGPPAPAVRGTLQTTTYYLLPGVTYYFAVKGVEADGLRAVLSNGATVYTSAASPAGVALAGVWLSSAAVSFSTGGAAAYVVDASTDSQFGGVLASSSSAAAAAPAMTLAPQGLLPNTTYFLRAGALWGAATYYASALSTATLAKPVTAPAVSAVYASSVAISWTPLPVAPPAASSMSAEGYVLQASTASDFSGAVFSSRTYSAASASLTVAGLSAATTYYFRTASLNWSGAANFAATVSTCIPVPTDPWPPGAVADLAGAAGVEGRLTLQWTAPDADANVFPSSSAVAGYQIRIATYSVAGIGGSTTAWWNSAADVRSLALPAVAAAPPAPAFPGTVQSLTLDGLWPGVTYYAMLVSSDAAGNLSGADLLSIPPGAQANALVFDAAPPAPAGLAVTPSGSAALLVTWTASSAYDLDRYKIYYDSTPPYDFSHSTWSFVTAFSTSALLSGLAPGTYAVKVTAVDRGAPSYPGVALESVSAGSATATIASVGLLPQAPFGVAISSSIAGVTLRWMPVTRFEDGTPFAVSSSPVASELSGYRIFRATSAVDCAWAAVSAPLSTAAWTWTDPAGTPQDYYSVAAANSSGWSERSVIRTMASKSAFVVAPDAASYFEIMASDVEPIEGQASVPDSAYLIRASSRPQDLGDLNGRVVKSLEFDAYQGGRLLSPGFKIANSGILRLHYDMIGSEVLPSSFRSAGVPPTPENMSVYWHNGRQWVQLFGRLDTTARTMTISTPYLGRYQLRTVERSGGFSFDMAGVSNEFLTPNGDGKNDNVVFTFDNPRDSAVTGKIADRQGRVIVGSLPSGPVSNSLMWDGKAGGRVVPGGVYIYQIHAEGATYSGTVVVIR